MLKRLIFSTVVLLSTLASPPGSASDEAQRSDTTGGAVKTYFIHTDHLNTPRAVSNPDGATVWKWSSDSFGSGAPMVTLGLDERTFLNLRYPGQYADRETGLYYNYYRDYDPQTGRYLQSDPIGLGGGINTYGYVGGNPLSATDPQGLNPAWAVARAGRIGWNIGQAINPAVQPYVAAGLDAVFGDPYAASYGTKPERTAAQEAQADLDRDHYKRICEEPPPPNLDECETAKWQRDRAKQCKNLRQDWDNKFWPGRHDEAIRNAGRSETKWDKIVSRVCKCP